MRGLTLATLLGLAVGCSAPVPREDLDGTWNTVTGSLEGVPPGPGQWVFAGGRLEFRNEDVPPSEARYALDPGGRPGTLNLVHSSGPAKGKTLKGIYRRENGRLWICYVAPSRPDPEQAPRPTDFEGGPESGVWVYELELVSP